MENGQVGRIKCDKLIMLNVSSCLKPILMLKVTSALLFTAVGFFW